MNEELYTIDQVAARLQLHVKTVRKHVRDGRLKATRIGKQYRITAADLAAFAGTPVSAAGKPVVVHRSVDAATVIEISAISPEDSSRLSNTLMAAMNSSAGNPSLRVDTIYYPEVGRLKVILHGDLLFTADLLRIVHVMLQAARTGE